MNEYLTLFARKMIKDDLSKLPLSWRKKFIWLYRQYCKQQEPSIEEVVDAMPDDKLDWAMQQVKNSLKKLNLDQQIKCFGN